MREREVSMEAIFIGAVFAGVFAVMFNDAVQLFMESEERENDNN